MSRGLLTTLLVLIWLGLSGLEDFSDIGLNGYGQLHRSPTAVLVGTEEATEINEIRNIALHIERRPLASAASVSWQYLKPESRYSKEDSRIYKLHSVFRI
jgi:hypothetical protein